MLPTPRTRSVASLSLTCSMTVTRAPLPAYSISPPRSNFPRVRAIMRSRLAFTSGARSRRMINRSASARIESSACMKFPFFRLLVSSDMIGEGGGLVSGRCQLGWLAGGKLWRRSTLADLLAPHGVVKAGSLEQVVVLTHLDDPAALENVNPVGVHDRR